MWSHRKERRLFIRSDDDSAMKKQVEATHIPDGRHDVDVMPVIHILYKIFMIQPTNLPPHEKREQETLEITAPLAESHMLASHAFIMYKISCKLSGKYDSRGGESHGSTMVFLNYMSSYSWHAKVVLTLSAFVSTFPEFWHVAKRPQFDALNELIKTAMDVTMCIIEFKDLRASEYISEDSPPMSIVSAHIPSAVYWVIRSVVVCASQLASLVGTRKESTSSTTVASEMSNLAKKISSIYEEVNSHLAECKKYIADKKDKEGADKLDHFYKSAHIDNMKILRALIYAKDDLLPLIDGTTKSRVGLAVLKRTYVLLLISDLDISVEEIMALNDLYRDARARGRRQYEIVWIPVVDKASRNDDVNRHKFEDLQSMMLWHSVCDPSIIETSVIRFIRVHWNFTKSAILVALDPQGKVVNSNAFPMLWVWGSMAFPFTRMREELLWQEQVWRLELLVDGIDPKILEWIREAKLVCVYGGEDLEWIQEITTYAKDMARTSGVKIEMVYVGKSKASRERMQKIIGELAAKKYSHYLPNFESIWLFWTRLESMLFSKINLGSTLEKDQIMSEIMTVLSFDCNDEGWTLLSKGGSVMTRAKGDAALPNFRDLYKYIDQTDAALPSFVHDYMQHTPHHCNRLILPNSIDFLPTGLVCVECGRRMEEYFMYRCCVE